MIISRREMLLLSTGVVIYPTISEALIPPPPSSPWYLIFISDGLYRITSLTIVDLPASVGTCQNYTRSGVTIEFGETFSFTGRTGISAWNQLTGAPQYKWWEVLDRRNGRYYKLFEFDRIEARFADKSRVKVVFRGPNAFIPFEPLVGTERLPDGTRLYPRTTDRDGGGGEYKGRGSRDGGGVTSVTPKTTMFAWHWSSQETPW